ncbi:MAG TPA: tetratricopeptide repeat protein [Phycisphaerae bacterium]|nr:tetratricopeptide repeat protein [Phycisphaerae bacterium]
MEKAPARGREPIALAGVQDAATLEQAVAMIAESRHAEAAAQLAPLSERFHSRNEAKRAAESMFWLGYCYEKLGRPNEAAGLYGRVVQEYPQQPASRQAGLRLSQIPKPDQP